MRTRLTLDPDVAEQVRREAAKCRRSIKQVINERLRTAYGLEQRESLKPFKVTQNSSGYRAGVDRQRLNQLVDELELEAIA